MGGIRNIEDVDCDELKQYCKWNKSMIAVASHGPTTCEGEYCEDAYSKWYADNAVECEICGNTVEIGTCEESINLSDGSRMLVCEDCMAEAE